MRLLPSLLAGMRDDRLSVLDRIRRTVGPVARLPLLRIVFVCEPNVAREVLHDTESFPDKGIGLREARRYLADGRLTATGAEWTAGHRRASPLYTPGAMARSVAAAARTFEGSLEEIDSNPLALQPHVDRAIILGTLSQLLGEERALEIDPAPILRDLRILTAWSGRQVSARPPAASRLSWWLSAETRRARWRLEAAIGEWRRRPGTGAMAELSALDAPSACAETLTLLVAGFETTSATTAFAIDSLSRSARWADAIARDGRDRAMARQAVLETLRLHPPVWAITRSASRAASIGGYPIRRGDRLLISVHGLHRDPGVWDEPSRFDPDRFARGHPPAAFMPFGFGPRQCVGRQAGIGEVAILIGSLFSRFHVEPADPASGIRAGLTQTPNPPRRYSLKRRSQ